MRIPSSGQTRVCGPGYCYTNETHLYRGQLEDGDPHGALARVCVVRVVCRDQRGGIMGRASQVPYLPNIVFEHLGTNKH